MTHDTLQMVEYRNTPAVLVLADSEEGRRRTALWAERAGCRVSDAVGIEGGAERVDLQIATDAVLVEIERDHGPGLDLLLDRLNAGARTGRYGCVVIAPAELIDIVAARISHPDVIHLCAPSAAERMLAIGIACEKSPGLLQDIGKGTARLQQLSEEVGRIANILATLSEDEAAPSAGDEEEEGAVLSSESLRTMIRARRLRGRYFQDGLFADPAWDMLLDLMAARLDRQRVAVSSLCIAAAVPATTALRWIKTLTDHGLFVRTADPQDGRRVFIELSDQAAANLGNYLKEVQRLYPLVV